MARGRNIGSALLLVGVAFVAACGPGEQTGPRGEPTPADLQTPVPVEPGFPAEPVIPTPHGPGETMPAAPPPTSLPTP